MHQKIPFFYVSLSIIMLQIFNFFIMFLLLFFLFLFCSFRIYIYFCRQNSKHIIMKAMTLSPSSPVSAKYWSELKDLSNSVKLELITLLSSSVANSVSEPSSEKGWTKSFAGRWQDDRTAEEIIEDIRSSGSKAWAPR